MDTAAMIKSYVRWSRAAGRSRNSDARVRLFRPNTRTAHRRTQTHSGESVAILGVTRQRGRHPATFLPRIVP